MNLIPIVKWSQKTRITLQHEVIETTSNIKENNGGNMKPNNDTTRIYKNPRQLLQDNFCNKLLIHLEKKQM